MGKDKSIIERFTDTVKDLANSASEALKAEEPPKVDQSNAVYMPFAAEGLVSDPLLVLPVAALPPRRKQRGKKAAKTSSVRKATAKRAAPKTARKAAKTSTRGRSKAAARHAAKALAKRSTRNATMKRSTKHSASGRGRR
jgi:hypothetical protein